MEEDAAESGKRGYVNLKHVIWHAAFYEIICLVEVISRLGYKLQCGDAIERWLFILILILSADYEEQYVILCLAASLSLLGVF
jgi:hypothetical protein